MMVDRSWLCDKLWQNTVLNVAKCNLGNTIDHKHTLTNGNIKQAQKCFKAYCSPHDNYQS